MQELALRTYRYYCTNIAKIIYYTCFATLFIVFLERFFIIFSYEAHTAGIDNNFDYPIIRSLAGYAIYPDPSAYPYAVNPYAPLFFITGKWVASVLNVKPQDTIQIYWVSRFLCVLADVGTCLILYRALTKLLQTSRIFSVAAIAIFFCIISYLGYTINRSDAFFLFFYCSAVYVLISTPNKKRFRQILLLPILTSLCIFSKQNGIVLLLLIPAWYLIEKNYKLLFYYLLLSSILLTVTFIFFQFNYSHGYFSKHIVEALNNKIDPRWFYSYIFKLIAPTYLTLPLAISLVIGFKFMAGHQEGLQKKIGLLCILQFVFGTALSFKWGSSLGYYNESFLLGVLAIALFQNRTQLEPKTYPIQKILPYLYPAFGILIFNMIAQLYFFFINNSQEAKDNYNEQAKITKYIKKEIGTKSNHVLDLSNADFNFFKNMLFKECAAPNIDAVNCCTLPDGIFDYSGLLQGLKNGKIMFIIKEKNTELENIWNVDIQHYKKDSIFSHYTVYRYTPPEKKNSKTDLVRGVE